MRSSDLGGLVLCLWGLVLLTGCNVSPTPATSTGTTTTTSQQTGAATRIIQSSILVTQYSQEPASVLVFDGTTSGISKPYFEFTGGIPAIDAAGNLYVANSWGVWNPSQSRDINIYSLNAVDPGKPLRTLHTHLTNIWDMTVSRSGEIFAADGNGVAVFSATASGDDAPIRYLQLGTAYAIAVDSSENLYVETGYGKVSVFGPTATGAAVPVRVIGGPQTQIRSEYRVDYGSLAVDALGNLYVLCVIDAPEKVLNAFRVLVFAPDAKGDVAPLRFVTTSPMTNAYDGTAIAVDASGTIYVSASLDLNEGAVFEFPADAYGSVTPSKIISSGKWGENAGGIALY
jgi:hypothetical protein